MSEERLTYLLNGYEGFNDNGGLNRAEYLELFSYLIKSGRGFQMKEGYYQHECMYLIGIGYISENGDILID